MENTNSVYNRYYLIAKSAAWVGLVFLGELSLIFLKFAGRHLWAWTKVAAKKLGECIFDFFKLVFRWVTLKSLRDWWREHDKEMENPLREEGFEIVQRLSEWKKDFPDGAVFVKRGVWGDFSVRIFVNSSGVFLDQGKDLTKGHVLALYRKYGDNIQQIYNSTLDRARMLKSVVQEAEDRQASSVQMAVGANSLPSEYDADEIDETSEVSMRGKTTKSSSLSSQDIDDLSQAWERIKSEKVKVSKAFTPLYERMYDLCKDAIESQPGWDISDYTPSEVYRGVGIDFTVVNRKKGLEYEGSATLHGDKELLNCTLWTGDKIAVILGNSRLKEFVGESNWKHIARNRWKKFLKEKGL